MKSKIIIYITMIFFAICITSCEDILKEEPKTFVSPDYFFTSANDFDAAVIGLYGVTNELIDGIGEQTTWQMQIREVFGDYYDEPQSVEHAKNMWRNNPSSDMWTIRWGWSKPYVVISNANQVLSALESTTVLSAAEIAEFGAEAKLMRAYAYFNLVQLFGDVPLRTEPMVGLDDLQIERSPQSSVYELIIQDLIDAEAGLPETSSVEGRANMYVAKALLARVYLTTAGNPMNITANYALALAKAKELIPTENANSPYKLLEDVSDVFKNTSYTTESIWDIQYSIGITSNDQHNHTAPTPYSAALLLPTDTFISSFSVGDNRREWGIRDSFVTSGGTKFIARTYFNKFIDESKLEQELSPASTQTDYTFPLIRLAEMYLIAAEAENEVTGPTADAYDFINEIRRRARVDKADVTHVPDLAGLADKAAFRAAVIQERKWELFTEGHAWFDLKRTNTFQNVEDARGSELLVPIGAYNQTWIISDYELLNNDIPDNPAYVAN